MGKSLLLADDSVTIQKVVGLSFASEDIEITTVDNGDDALARARELRPDVILADVVMPGMSGYEVCEAIKADAELQHIPVLLLTGTFEAFDDARAAQVGAAGHVAKPFEAQTLVERVKELLANAPAPAPPAPPVAETPPPTPIDTAPDETQTVETADLSPPAAPASFDFFDEPASTEAPVGAAAAEPELGAFSFATDDLEPASNVAPPPPADHTIAILPDEIPPVPASAEAASTPPAPTRAPSESFDFEFESVRAQPTQTPPEPPAPTQISEASLLDPAGDSAFDVSSSDLDDLAFSAQSEAPPAPPTQLLDPEEARIDVPEPAARRAGGIPSLDADPVMELLSSPQLPDEARAEFVDVAPEAPIEDAAFAIPEPIGNASFPMPEPDPEPVAEAALATPEPELDTDAPFAMPEPEADVPAAEPFATAEPTAFAPPATHAEPAWPSEPVVAEPVADAQMVADEPMAEALPDVDALLTEITPVLREQLHETLEKIAWESFGQVTETIVEHAVERLEKAAWEVVPKLAETLILEEIRKLKGE